MVLGCEEILACSWEWRIARVWQRSSPMNSAQKHVWRAEVVL